MVKMTKCLICEETLFINSLSCKACNTRYKGEFYYPRLARLSLDEQKLVESLISHGGNLKEMSEVLCVSYPTLKKRLNELSTSLQMKKAEDEKKIQQILKEIELQNINAQEGIKLIREINGEL